MIVKNSIRQMLRTPVKTFVFLLLIVCSGALLTIGANLWLRSNQNLKEYEASFFTIGTVEQKPVSIRQDMEWDAGRKDYEIFQSPEYDYVYPVSVLQFEGADYIKEPEKRSYYASYAPEYHLVCSDNADFWVVIAEFSPVEDCIPDESVQVHVTRILNGDKNLEDNYIWFCDHTNENPLPLSKDKTYIAQLGFIGETHGGRIGNAIPTLEYAPSPLETSQYTENGQIMEDILKEPFAYYEVAPGFYQSEEGKRYLNYADGLSMPSKTFPVTGTGATMLLMPFQRGDAYICEGNDISQEEYETGEKVCLISRTFAQNNALSIGDMVHTALYYTNAKDAASRNYRIDGSQGFSFNILNADGEVPAVFEESTYKIVGIYDTVSGEVLGNYQMAGDEMIVPMNSIQNRDCCNILAYGPMKGSTTSFQIPNGSIDKFMEEWAKQGITDLDITFYDRGYSELKSGIDQMKSMSILLSGIGLSISIFLLLLFNHLFIAKQKKRIAIERCMGVSKGNCRMSLTTGMFLILLAGSLLGCALGAMFADRIYREDFHQTAYDMTYSNVNASDVKSELEEKNDVAMAISVFGLCAAFLIITGTGMMIYNTNQILRLEPMSLLSGSNDKE